MLITRPIKSNRGILLASHELRTANAVLLYDIVLSRKQRFSHIEELRKEDLRVAALWRYQIKYCGTHCASAAPQTPAPVWQPLTPEHSPALTLYASAICSISCVCDFSRGTR